LAARPPWPSPVQCTGRPPRHFLSVRVRKRLSACFLAPRVLRVTFEDASRRARLAWSCLGHSPTKSKNTCSAAGGSPQLSDLSRSPPTEVGLVRPKTNCLGLPTGGGCSPTEAGWLLPLAMRASSLGVLKDHPSTDKPSRCPLPRAARDTLRSRAASSSTRSVLAVSHDFDGLLHLGAAGLLHPAAGPGIHHVSGCARARLGGLDRGTSPVSAEPVRAGPVRVADLAASRLRDQLVLTEVSVLRRPPVSGATGLRMTSGLHVCRAPPTQAGVTCTSRSRCCPPPTQAGGACCLRDDLPGAPRRRCRSSPTRSPPGTSDLHPHRCRRARDRSPVPRPRSRWVPAACRSPPRAPLEPCLLPRSADQPRSPRRLLLCLGSFPCSTLGRRSDLVPSRLCSSASSADCRSRRHCRRCCRSVSRPLRRSAGDEPWSRLHTGGVQVHTRDPPAWPAPRTEVRCAQPDDQGRLAVPPTKAGVGTRVLSRRVHLCSSPGAGRPGVPVRLACRSRRGRREPSMLPACRARVQSPLVQGLPPCPSPSVRDSDRGLPCVHSRAAGPAPLPRECCLRRGAAPEGAATACPPVARPPRRALERARPFVRGASRGSCPSSPSRPWTPRRGSQLPGGSLGSLKGASSRYCRLRVRRVPPKGDPWSRPPRSWSRRTAPCSTSTDVAPKDAARSRAGLPTSTDQLLTVTAAAPRDARRSCKVSDPCPGAPAASPRGPRLPRVAPAVSSTAKVASTTSSQALAWLGRHPWSGPTPEGDATASRLVSPS
jgi:hypothetical protein